MSLLDTGNMKENPLLSSCHSIPSSTRQTAHFLPVGNVFQKAAQEEKDNGLRSETWIQMLTPQFNSSHLFKGTNNSASEDFWD